MATPNINNAIMTLIAIYRRRKLFTEEKLSRVNDNFLDYVRTKHGFLTCENHRELLKTVFNRYIGFAVQFPFDNLTFPDIDPNAIKQAKLVEVMGLSDVSSLPNIWFENGIITKYKQLKYFDDNPEKIFELPFNVPVTDNDDDDQVRMIAAYRLLQTLNVPVDIGSMFEYYDNYEDFICNGFDTYVALDSLLTKELGN